MEEAETKESRAIGGAFAKVSSTLVGKKWIGESIVIGMMGSKYANQRGIDEARDGRKKSDEKIRVANEKLAKEKEERKERDEPAMPEKPVEWGRWQSRTRTSERWTRRSCASGPKRA